MRGSARPMLGHRRERPILPQSPRRCPHQTRPQSLRLTRPPNLHLTLRPNLRQIPHRYPHP